jgi:hypothetical protein
LPKPWWADTPSLDTVDDLLEQFACAAQNPMVTSRRDRLTAALTAAGAVTVPDLTNAQDRDHDHDHDHGHDHQAVPSDPALRVKALESLLVAKGLVDRAAVDALIDTYEHKVGPRNGARVVARAWSDPDYKRRLLTDANAALAELGYGDEIKTAAARGEPDDGSRYYHHWLAALERLVVTKGLSDPAALLARKEAWADAYRHTPHGSPVELECDSSAR